MGIKESNDPSDRSFLFAFHRRGRAAMLHHCKGVLVRSSTVGWLETGETSLSSDYWRGHKGTSALPDQKLISSK